MKIIEPHSIKNPYFRRFMFPKLAFTVNKTYLKESGEHRIAKRPKTVVGDGIGSISDFLLLLRRGFGCLIYFSREIYLTASRRVYFYVALHFFFLALLFRSQTICNWGSNDVDHHSFTPPANCGNPGPWHVCVVLYP